MKFKNTKNAIICISIFCVFAIFKNSITKYLNSLCLDFHIDTWTSFTPLLILTICFIIYFCILLIIGYVPSEKILIITILFGSIICCSGLYYGNCAVFSCFILLFLTSQVSLFIMHLIKKLIRMFRNKGTKGFISDEPIPVEEKDKSNFFIESCNKLFGIKEKEAKPDNKGYALYAQNIAKKIKESHFEKSFAIGINGQWGSGKTSMSNLIRRHTQDEKDVISIDFKPWSSSTPDAIIRDFFETLQDELSPYHAALSRLLIRYSRKLTTIDSNVITQTIEYAANYILDLDATNKVYEKINAALKDVDKKIIIYIDDLDRLEQNEIMEVIRLIRNTANFYNTFFIVSYDKAYVNNALEKTGIYNHEKFLEKIFQLEVNLPYYDKGKLREELAQKLEALFPEKITDNIKKEIIEEIHPSIPNILDDWLENSRDVTRLCNSLMLNYPRVKEYVVFKEFLLIEVLRINYPSVYYDLYNRRKDFFEEKNNSGKFEFKKDNEEKILLEKYLEEKIEIENNNIFRFLNNIFYENVLDESYDHQSNHQDSIVRVKRFYIYFNYINFDKVLAYQEFNNAYDSSEEDFSKKIKEWVDNKLGIEVSERLGSINNFNTKYDLEKYARALILFYHLFNNSKTLDYFTYIKKKKDLIKQFYDDNSENMMQSIFQPSNKKDIKRKLNFIVSFGDFEILSFQNTFLILFETLIENSSKFNSSMSICVTIAKKLPEVKVDTINKIKEFILDKEHLQGFLLSTLCERCLKNYSVSHIGNRYIGIFFPDLIEFEELLISLKEESKYVEEYYKLYNKCKESNFKDKFDFPFSHFPTIEEWEKGL